MDKKRLFWIFALSSIVYFSQGIEGLPGQSLFIYMKNILKLTPSQVMYLGSLTGLAWLIKPIIGAVIDKSGLKKKTWIILGLGISILISAVLGLSYWPLWFLILMLFLANWNACFRDVTVDGIMCVEGKESNNCGRIQAIQWISLTLAGILVGIGGGYIAQHLTYKMGYLALIPFYLLVIGIALKYGEKKSVKTEIKKISYKELFRNKKFAYAGLFLFLYCFSPSFGTPLSFMQRDVFHWSEQWIGILGTIISVLEIIGAILYYKFSTKINIKKWLIGSVILGATTTMCYLYYTPVSAIVYGCMFAVIGMFIHLVVMDFMARNSIGGLEATSFAGMCSIHNLAGTLSSLSGAYLLPKIGLQPLIIISSLTSFLCLLLIKKVGFNEEKQKC